ncbi:endonuclease/exonuclease/phosphatase family protein [Marinibacterium sp. SX1]|uniref:endonuclease/exonuclease/phosphatase family protein n=1 Tax=Marinibacterium sp. SX1 TaxID=3388424 RepID=UPI003D17D841
MRPILTRTTATLQTPSQDDRDQARASGGDRAAHDRMMSDWPCMTAIELTQPDTPLPLPAQLTICAWNMERCKRVEDSAALLRAAGADVVLATEMDHGMARSGQRHTTRDLARALGMGHVYGTEFVELGTGDPYETSLFADVPNDHGLHGNAILSRYPLIDPCLVPLDDGGLWYVTNPKGDGQHRVGGRMAMAARIDTANGPLTLAAAHYESESDPSLRAEQTRILTDALDARYGTGKAVIGGDLNTNWLADGTRTAAEITADPASVEPSFAHFAQAGYDWRGAVAPGFTTRAAPGKSVKYPLMVLDWLLVRDVAPFDPRIWPAVSAAGQYLSDHEMLSLRIIP